MNLTEGVRRKKSLARQLKCWLHSSSKIKQKGETTMKKMIAGIALQFATAIAGAHHEQSELNIVSNDRNMISVSLDNNYYSQFTPAFNVCGIEPGCHYVIIVKRYFNPHGHAWGRGYRDEVVYSGYLQIPFASRVLGAIDCRNILSLNVQQLGPPVSYYEDSHCGRPYIGMDPQSFNKLKQVVANRWFDSSKLEVAKQGISGYAISSAQLAELMGLLSFESSKLELAKFGYQYVADKQKFYIVNDAFSFESSISELNRFIGRG